jgi:hypothetical protein
LRKVGEKREAWRLAWQLDHVFDFYEFTLDRRWRIGLDGLEHDLVQLRGLDFLAAVFINLNSRFERFQYPLFGQCGNKQNRYIHKWRQAFLDLFCKLAGAGIVLFDQIPLVDQYYHPLLVAFNQVKDRNILRFYSTGGIQDQDTHIRVFNSPDRAHGGIKLNVLLYLGAFTQPSGVNQEKVVPELVVPRVNRIARGARHIVHDVALFTR